MRADLSIECHMRMASMESANFNEDLQDLMRQQAAILQNALVGHHQLATRLQHFGVKVETTPLVAYRPESLRMPIASPNRERVLPPRRLTAGGISPNKSSETLALQEPLLQNREVTIQELQKQVSPSPFEDRPRRMRPEIASKWKDKGKLAARSRTYDGVHPEMLATGEEDALKDKKKRHVFPNADAMKERLLEKLNKPTYHVEDMYSHTGWAQSLARNECFQNAALVVILANTLWIAVDTDNNKAPVLCEAAPFFQIVNNLFCIAFVSEVVVRFCAFEKKCSCLQDAWFVFDALLVFLMAWETWVEVALFLVFGIGGNGGGAASFLRIFRMLRLTRVARLARIIRQMPELMILVKGMVIATRSVIATLALLLVIIYIFSVLFTQLLSETEAAAGCFETVPQAMNCLLLNGVFSEEREFIERMYDVHWIFYVITIVYLLLASLTVLNMLIGVLCEVISVTAKVEQEELMMQDLKAKMTTLMPHFSGLGNQCVSREKFQELLEKPEAAEALHSVGVDVLALVDFSDFIFRDSEDLPLGDFMEKVLQFRGSNTATVKDVVDFRMFLQQELEDVRKCISQCFKKHSHITDGASEKAA